VYKVGIFTAGKAGKRIFDLCREIADIQIIAFIDNNANLYANTYEGIPIISPYKLKKMVLQHEVEMVLVPSDRMISYGLREYTQQLDSLDITCYKIVPSWIIKKQSIETEDILKVNELILKGEFGAINQLQHLQFHVIDNCNLNCKRCQHFSNIAKPQSYAS
jgi:FlaA1/EpsC-like NDP-sugar epimerase